MRVLWFTNTPSLFNTASSPYNGGGWISSLEELMVKQPDVELGLCFFHDDINFKVVQNNTTYYPVSLYNTLAKKLKHNLFHSSYDGIEVNEFLKVINDFKPDLIHIFGSERSFGLISYHVNIPIVIHIQGILIPYLNASFPPATNMYDYFRYVPFTKIFSYIKSRRFFKHNAKREQLILQNAKNFMGRTNWDKGVVNLYAPNAQYFYASEILRKKFYAALPWKFKNSETLQIVSTISQTSYKGFDLILKTAQLLKTLTNVSFNWRVYGVTSYNFWENKLGIKAADVNVKQMGVTGADGLIEAIQTSAVYVHPSYIDNSPNSVCEAQLIGIPIIACNVGGMSSLINNGIDGILVPANDPFTLSAQVLKLFNDHNLAATIGENARGIAIKRHNPEDILLDNLNVYKLLKT